MKGKYIVFLILLTLGSGGFAWAQDSARVRIQLIAADNAEGPSDGALEGLMAKLNRMPYKRFRQKGRKTVTLRTGQDVKAGISGHTMKLKLESVKNRRATMHLNWRKGGASVVNLTAVTKQGSPFVCGGPREGSTTWIAVFSLE